MGVFVSLGIVILAMLVQAFLQLTPGLYMLFRHQTNGKWRGYFALGAATTIAVLLMVVNYVVFDSTILRWIMVGVLVAYGVFCFFSYYRKGEGTELIISRRVAKTLTIRTKRAKSSSDAFILGAMGEFAESIFIVPLMITTVLGANGIDDYRLWVLLCYVVAAVIPLLIIEIYYQCDKNLSEIQKIRVKNKNFYRIMIGACCLVMAMLMASVGVLQ